MIGNTAFALMIALMIRAIGALDGCYDGRTASIITGGYKEMCSHNFRYSRQP